MNTKKQLDKITNRLKNKRLELGYSYQDLADRTGINKSTLYRYENGGIRNLPLKKLEILASALSTSSEYLLALDDFIVDSFTMIDDSMKPFIYPNDELKIAKTDYKNKDIVLIKYNDNLICRKLIITDNMLLYPINNDYEPISLSKEDFEKIYQGTIKEITRKL